MYMMFMNDVNKKEEVKKVVYNELRSMGIKNRPKKIRQNVQESRKGSRIFGIPLHLLPIQQVTLESGQQLVIPKIIHQMCSYVLKNVETEGIFRKEGSKARQNEIKLSLNAGCSLGNEHHVIDIACLLKTFFRELPEPLLPINLHELFLRCTISQDILKSCLLTSLLLPTEHLSTLTYFMQFLKFVSQFSVANKMDSHNLSIVFGPTLMPIGNKQSSLIAQNQMTNIRLLIELFIENSTRIGVLPESVLQNISSPSSSLTEEDNSTNNKKKRRRRSGSLTRIWNGIMQKVGGNGKQIEESEKVQQTLPDILQTPKMLKSERKRKLESTGISNKKKKAVVSNLPQNALIFAPYTPSKTPVYTNPNPQRQSPTESCPKSSMSKNRKLSHWPLMKKPKMKIETVPTISSSTNSLLTRSFMDLNWASVNFGKSRKRHSDLVKPSSSNLQSEPNQSEDVIEIPRSEYEEMENRISVIEKDLKNIKIESMEIAEKNANLNEVEKVQNEYEKMLTNSTSLSPATDKLARRLSKELKIRRSCEHKVMRSPSARKIGSLRRRSRELDKNARVKVSRTKTWHDESTKTVKKVAIKNTQKNDVRKSTEREKSSLNNSASKYSYSLRSMTSDTTSSTFESNNDEDLLFKTSNKKLEKSQNPFTMTLRQQVYSPKILGSNPLRSSLNLQSVETTNSKLNTYTRRSLDTITNSKENKNGWKSAEGFFRNSSASYDNISENCRASITRLRSQNAGMVMAKAKLFDNISDPDDLRKMSMAFALQKKTNNSKKIGSVRIVENPRSFKNNLSPRKRACKVAHPHLKITSEGSCDKENFCSEILQNNMPAIKRSLTKRSPKKMVNIRGTLESDNNNRKTPLKAVRPI